MERLLAAISSISFGVFFMLPWIMVRLGKHKSWYLAHFAPPFIWGRALYGWPAVTTFFVSIPILAILPISDDAFMSLMGWVGLAGVALGVVLMIWTPRWAKPKWQRYLEDKYTWLEIRGIFVPAWRKMDRKKWNSLLDSEEGIKELVRLARENR